MKFNETACVPTCSVPTLHSFYATDFPTAWKLLLAQILIFIFLFLKVFFSDTVSFCNENEVTVQETEYYQR